MIVTFYSFKGGVGRSMAVANVAAILARQSLRVLMIDFDLEAPGLEQYFEINHAATRRNPGLLDLLLTYKRSMSVASGSAEPEFKRIEKFIGPVYPSLPGGGCLHLLAAGQREPREQLDRYAANLRTFDWQDFYYNWEGELFFEWLRSALVPVRSNGDGTKGYHVVLVDSRTGVTEMGGICTYQLADAIVMLSAANQQNRQGTLNVAADFVSPPVQVARRDRPLDILAVPARVEQTDPELLERFIGDFERQFATYLPERLRKANIDFRHLMIPYEPAYAFEERVVSDPSRAAERRAIAGAFERLADAVKLLFAKDGQQLPQPQATVVESSAPLQYNAAKRFAGYDVFVSYAVADAEAGEALVRELTDLRAEVFVDRRELVMGEDWRARTEQALFHSRVCLVCFGAGQSAGRDNDVLSAIAAILRSRDLPIVPVLLAGDPGVERQLPPALRDRQWLDLRSGISTDDARSALRQIVRPAQAEPQAAHAHDDAPPSASSTVVSFGAPYPGDRPYTEADVGFFFGRDNAIGAVVDKLRQHRFAVVSGPSACGKTSLIEGGVLPAMRKADAATTWGYVRCVPAQDALRGLDAAISQLLGITCNHRLLFVDEFEQVSRQGAATEPSAYVARLRNLLAGDPNLSVIVAVRDAHLSSLASTSSGFATDEQRVKLAPLNDAAFRTIIEKPAERAGLAFEPGLVDRVIADWGQDQRFLPFLQSVLQALWLQRREGFLTNRAYDTTPDPVEDIAEKAFADRVDLQRAMERVIPRLFALCGNLVQLNASCSRDDLQVAGIPKEQVDQVIAHLTDRHLFYMFAADDGTARIAPAFAVEQWDRPHKWYTNEQPFLEWLASVHTHRLDWEHSGRDDGALLTGTLLTTALEWLSQRPNDLTAAETSFITRSRDHDIESKTRSRRYRAISGAIFIAAVVIIGILVLNQARTAQRARDEAARAQQNRRAAAVSIENGDNLLGAGDVQGALKNYSSALELVPDNTTALLRRGGLFDQQGDFQRAIKDFTRVIELTEPVKSAASQKLLADAHLARGLSLIHAGKMAEALKDLDEAATHNPRDPAVLASRGTVLERLGRDSDALLAYSEALKVRPDPDVAFSRGVLLQKLQKPREAAEDFRAVLTSSNASPQAQAAARARLTELGQGANVQRTPENTRVFIHLVDRQDRGVGDQLLKALAHSKYAAQGVQVVNVSLTSGETRFFYKEDERLATQVRDLAETVIADAGYNLRLAVRYVAAGKGVEPGTIEIWIPSLSDANLFGAKNRAYQSKY